MDSVLDDAKEVGINEIISDHEEERSEVVSDHQEEETNEVVADHHGKKTNEIVSEKVEKEPVFEETTNEIASVGVEKKTVSEEMTNENLPVKRNPRVVFVLGGPGGGKSTQCANLAKQIGYTHLSSGDLLRKAMKLDAENGYPLVSRPMIESIIKEGKSVPSDVTMRILQKAIDESGNDKFLLDGFPRDEEIRSAFETATNIEPELVLFFDCSAEEREKRILSRNEGRVDDNPDSLRKRFKYFEEHTLPVVDYYRSKGIVSEVDAAKPTEEVFEKLKSILNPASEMQPEEGKLEATCELEKEIMNIKI
ncbi:UMP-CMP kinase 3 isoform X1 [Ricinus communis]|uniref:UMP-CMP kinase 3 isoform X1 n=1 Tax=Ricinus communis TaxID=3988 RepID=UPI00201AEEBE|nr:UMP-CMP kinase 3 isoform X1 [Ricinus communis]XP_048226524.1 UMP-CMP kinase 3 isoform X1 [Ricinus communis]